MFLNFYWKKIACCSTGWKVQSSQILIATGIGDTGVIRSKEKRSSFVLDNRPNPIHFDTRSRSARVVWLRSLPCAFNISSLAHSIFLCSRIQHFFAAAFCWRWSTNRSEKDIDSRAHWARPSNSLNCDRPAGNQALCENKKPIAIATWTTTFCKLDKYILQFWQIHFEICTNTYTDRFHSRLREKGWPQSFSYFVAGSKIGKRCFRSQPISHRTIFLHF